MIRSNYKIYAHIKSIIDFFQIINNARLIRVKLSELNRAFFSKLKCARVQRKYIIFAVLFIYSKLEIDGRR